MRVDEIKQTLEARFSEIYDARDFDFVMSDLLSRVPDTLDKREGSVIWDALAPAALEFVIIYYEQYNILRNSFGITADREWLILRALDRGVEIHEATYAVVKGEFDREIPEQFRFNYDKLNYSRESFLEQDEETGLFYYELICEMPGTVGNVTAGDLTPIDFIANLGHAKIVKVIVPGEDDEETESFRQRYFDDIRRQDYGGNIEDYKRKVMEIDGIGAVKVYPVWNGGGTVKLVIQNSEYASPSEEMIEKVQTIIDPIPNQGTGVGVAPIGHIVTVVGSEEVPINVSTNLSIEPSHDDSVIQERVRDSVSLYFKELAKEWGENKTTVVRVSQIEARILDIDGVIDVLDTTLNSGTSNIKLEGEQIPVMGEIAYE